jgi:GDP-mannose 6-dehydrogenase
LSFKPGTDDLRESPNAELIEMLIGKGYQVSIYDREVSLARIRGSNKTYIEQTIPHISSLMKASLDTTLEAADVVVVAKRSEEFEQIFTNGRNGVAVIDLVSILTDASDQKTNGYEGICW